MPARLTRRRLTVIAVVTAALAACGPEIVEGQVTSVDDEVCVTTGREQVCFDPTGIDGAGDLAPQECVELVRMAESGDVAEVRPCEG